MLILEQKKQIIQRIVTLNDLKKITKQIFNSDYVLININYLTDIQIKSILFDKGYNIRNLKNKSRVEIIQISLTPFSIRVQRG